MSTNKSFLPEPFTTDDMETVMEAFNQALKTILGQYQSEDQRTALKTFVVNVVVQEKPWMWTSPEGQEHLQDLCMVDEFPRDFIMGLTFAFFSRWAEASVKFTGLTDALSWGSSADSSEDPKYVLMSDNISKRLSKRDDVKTYLAANKWVVVLMLLKLFVVPEAPATSVEEKKTGTQALLS